MSINMNKTVFHYHYQGRCSQEPLGSIIAVYATRSLNFAIFSITSKLFFAILYILATVKIVSFTEN